MDATMARRPASANADSRPVPMAHRQFKLLPVPVREMDAWNARVEAWATGRG